VAIDWKKVEEKYYMNVVNRQPMVLVKGVGTKVWDDTGKQYLDFTAGWAVNNIGHSHPVIADAVSEQAKMLLQTSNQFYSVPQLKLAEVLVENSCMDKIFIANSGAEANEGAIKIARKYGKLYRNGAHEVITTMNSFHGRTLATWSATGKPHEGDPFQPLPSGFPKVDYDDLDSIKMATTPDTAAVMLEPVQGEGGVNIPSPGYLEGVRAWCDENNLLLIFDEVQTGLGRLGTLFGYQSFDVEPDVITLAKGLGGGVPIGAILVKSKASVLEPGDHGSTFGGNALTCAAANASTRYIIDNNIPAHASLMGDYLRKGLYHLKENHGCIADVRGMGLLNAIEFDSEMAPTVMATCNELGLLLNAIPPDKIRLMPPLTVTKSEIDNALDILDVGLTQMAKGSTT